MFVTAMSGRGRFEEQNVAVYLHRALSSTNIDMNVSGDITSTEINLFDFYFPDNKMYKKTNSALNEAKCTRQKPLLFTITENFQCERHNYYAVPIKIDSGIVEYNF